MTIAEPRPQPARWRLRHLIAFLAVLTATVLAAGWVNGAWATDVNVTQNASCVNPDLHTFNVTVSAHNTYNSPLHVRVDNPASPIDLTLQPGQTWSYTFHVTESSWAVKFSSSDAHLKGDVAHTWTLSEVCGVPAATTTPPVTSCQQANPPRDDCVAAPPLPSTLPGVPTASTTAAPTTSTSDAVTSAPPASTPSDAGGGARSTTVTRLTLPVTGMNAWLWVLIGAAFVVAGSALVAVRRTYRDEDQL